MRLKTFKDPFLTLRSHKDDFELVLNKSIEDKRNSSDLHLWEVVRYSLQNGGKRIRPILSKIIGETLGKVDNVNYSCLCVEFFHTASLIADDMPFMDDDDYRRNYLSCHKKFGQAKALLASYALISWGYESINLAGESFSMKLNDKRLGYESVSIALNRVSTLAGIQGAVSGQHLDLFSTPQTLEDFREIIYKKTVTLFSLSFELGWIFGGGDLSKLSQVQEAASHFGSFFQLADDFQDREQDKEKSNVVQFLGEKKAAQEMKFHKDSFSRSIEKLGINRPEFIAIINYIEKKSGVNL